MNIFKEIINAWKGQTFSIATINDFSKMINEIKKMYRLTITYLIKHQSIRNLDKRLCSEDIFVNKAERKIRKRLVEHLAVQQNVDIGLTLVMMSIIKDAERIGDYIKNIYQTINKFKGKFNNKHPYYKPVSDIAIAIEPLIEATLKAFKTSDAVKARETIDKAYNIEKKCEEGIDSIINSKLIANEAAVLCLILRYFKRIGAHLCNISSSVIFPVHKIDFIPHTRKK